jgi:hypothetical protein
LVSQWTAGVSHWEPEIEVQVSISRKIKTAFHRPLRAKLIFNAGSGKAEDSPLQLVGILSEMQDQQILPEVYTVRPDSQKVSVKDGWLDVFTFSDMSKLNMISYAMLSQRGSTGNTGIQHYRVKQAKIHSIPRMPVLADGLLLGEGSLSVHVHPRALTVMTGAVLTGSQAGQKSRD